METKDTFGGMTIIVNEMLPPNTIMFHGGPRKQGESIEDYLKRHGMIFNASRPAGQAKVSGATEAQE